MKLRNAASQTLDALSWLGCVVEPDEVVTVPTHTVAAIEAGELLIDLSTWTVVEGDVPPAPAPPAVEPDVPAELEHEEG